MVDRRLQSRTNPGPASLRHHNAVLGTLRSAGFSVAMAAYAFSLLDSYAYGFALQETALPFDGPETVPAIAEQFKQQVTADEYAHLVEVLTEPRPSPATTTPTSSSSDST